MLPAASSAIAVGVARLEVMMGIEDPPPAGIKRMSGVPAPTAVSSTYALPAASVTMLAGDARLDAIVFEVPGVKMLRAPVPIPWSPWKTLVLERESVIFSAERRAPGRVGVNRTKTWHVLGGPPGAAGERLPVQVVLVML